MIPTMTIVVHDDDHDERLGQCGSECVSLESAPDGRIFYSHNAHSALSLSPSSHVATITNMYPLSPTASSYYHYHLTPRFTVTITSAPAALSHLPQTSPHCHFHFHFHCCILFAILDIYCLLPSLGPLVPLGILFLRAIKLPLEEVWWCRPSLITADVILENCPKTHKGRATKCPQLTATIQTTPRPLPLPLASSRSF